MKTIYALFAAVLVNIAFAPASHAAPRLSVDFFYDHLGEYGDWREVGDHGYCWQPRNVEHNWRPYADGHWVYTDAGWTWDSEEPYGWAVYHYGRWAHYEKLGWVWVPGTEWGPAWVSWRRGNRHVGWAPLPPESHGFDRSIGFGSRVDADYDIGPTSYSFVEVRNFGAPRLRSVLVEPRENITIINETTNITKITYVNNVVYNEGPSFDVISRESAQPIQRLRLERTEEVTATGGSGALRTRVEGQSLRVVAPTFEAATATSVAAPKRLAAKVETGQVDHGWVNAGPPAEVEKVRAHIKAEPASTTPAAAANTSATPASSPNATSQPPPTTTGGTVAPNAMPARPGDRIGRTGATARPGTTIASPDPAAPSVGANGASGSAPANPTGEPAVRGKGMKGRPETSGASTPNPADQPATPARGSNNPRGRNPSPTDPAAAPGSSTPDAPAATPRKGRGRNAEPTPGRAPEPAAAAGSSTPAAPGATPKSRRGRNADPMPARQAEPGAAATDTPAAPATPKKGRAKAPEPAAGSAPSETPAGAESTPKTRPGAAAERSNPERMPKAEHAAPKAEHSTPGAAEPAAGKTAEPRNEARHAERPEAGQKAAAAPGATSAPHQPENGKTKPKGKDEKKETKPDGGGQ